MFRDEKNGFIGGVLSGISNEIHIDVSLLRILFLCLFFFTNFPILIVYIILWMAVPNKES